MNRPPYKEEGILGPGGRKFIAWVVALAVVVGLGVVALNVDFGELADEIEELGNTTTNDEPTGGGGSGGGDGSGGRGVTRRAPTSRRRSAPAGSPTRSTRCARRSARIRSCSACWRRRTGSSSTCRVVTSRSATWWIDGELKTAPVRRRGRPSGRRVPGLPGRPGLAGSPAGGSEAPRPRTRSRGRQRDPRAGPDRVEAAMGAQRAGAERREPDLQGAPVRPRDPADRRHGRARHGAPASDTARTARRTASQQVHRERGRRVQRDHSVHGAVPAVASASARCSPQPGRSSGRFFANFPSRIPVA